MNILIRNRVPRTIQWIMNVFFIYLLLFTCFRIATIIVFKPASVRFMDLLPSCWLGLKYDLRWIAFILMPIALFSIFPKLSPYYSYRNKKMWTIYLGVVTLLVLFFYGADFGQFSYINARLNADALVFMEDPKDNLLVVWRSYPVIWILFALVGAVLMMTWMFRRVHVGVEDKNSTVHKFDYKRRWHLAAILLLGWFMYGFLTAGPLNVFKAFNLNDDFKSNIALNPLQNFFTSLRLTKTQKATNARPYYRDMQRFLHVDKTANEHYPYARTQQPLTTTPDMQPNVVLVIGKNFSMYKSSMSGNKLNATPYFKQLSDDGIFFEKCFSPSYGTARALFAILTGIPDVQARKYSAKTPETALQQTILNELGDYDKLFFSGGVAQYKNFEPLVQQVPGMKVFQPSDLRSGNKTVWGMSDLDLLLEADSVLNTRNKPFFAIIQTCNNQKPYQISPDEKWEQPFVIADEQLKNNGFESFEEYTAFSFMDYCYKRFMESASNRKYFNNTLFVFVGDHGVEGDASAVYPEVWTTQRLSEVHVPLLFYAPLLVTPEKRLDVVSQVDVLPGIMAFLNQPVINTTLGRNPFDNRVNESAALVMNHAWGWVGVVTNDYYFRKNLAGGNEEIFSISGKVPHDTTRQRLSILTSGIYETSRWLLLNNKP